MEIQSLNDNAISREKPATPPTAEKQVVEVKEEAPENHRHQERVYSKEEISKEITHLNKWLESKSSHLKFVMHDKLHEYYVQIVSDSSDEVVREIPSKKVMDAIAVFRENLGLIVDKKI